MSKPFNPLQDNHGKGVFEVAKANAHVGMEIAAVAALTPDRVAITFGSEIISFKQLNQLANQIAHRLFCLLYTSPSPRDMRRSRMPSSA